MLLDDDTYDRTISTHALLAEGDALTAKDKILRQISTHALLAEGDGTG